MHLSDDEFRFEIFILCFNFLLILFVKKANYSLLTLTRSCDHVCLFTVQQWSKEVNVLSLVHD